MKTLFWTLFLSIGLHEKAYSQDIFSHRDAKSVEEAEKAKDQAEEKRVNDFLKKNPQLLDPQKGLIIGNNSNTPHIFVFASPYCPHCKGIISDFLTLCENDPSLTICVFFIASPDDPDGFLAVKSLSIAHQAGKFKEAFETLNQSIRFLSTKEWQDFAEKAGIPWDAWEKEDSQKSLKNKVLDSIRVHEEMGFAGVPTVIIQEGQQVRLINGKPENANVLSLMLKNHQK